MQIGGQDSFAKTPVVVSGNQTAKSRKDVKSELKMAQAMPLRGEADLLSKQHPSVLARTPYLTGSRPVNLHVKPVWPYKICNILKYK